MENRRQKLECLKETELFLFDMDGTLYLGNRLFDFTAELLSDLKKRGKQYRFMTNNSSKSVADYVIKLKKMGIDSDRGDFITSAQATVYYLKKNHPDACLYVCGTQSLREEFERAGFETTFDPERAQCIVMGFDTELTFQKLRDVSYLLCTRKIPYIATNPDYVCPTEFGFVPDCGSVCDMIFRATGQRPVVIGKPEALMPQLAMEEAGVLPEKTAVVGDRIYTDVESGLRAGCLGVLVMSGETTPAILRESPVKPDLVLKDAAEILAVLRED
ncbi:MAG: HAD-IIA family hydrolase [Clostridia bacterium]|nr:HAD-IIA family hydrolase [Clostridia bacterium]